MNNAWLPVGSHTPMPPPPPPPDPGSQPSSFTHGKEITRQSVGWTGTLTAYTGPATLSGTQTITDKLIDGQILTIARGSDITLRNCRIIGPASATTYTLRHNLGGGSKLTLDRCEVITRAGALSARCLAMWDDGSFRALRSVFRGGIDNCFFNAPNSPGAFPTGDPLVPNARVLLEDCWFGDLERIGSSHSDNIQFDGGGYAVLRRVRLMCYSIPRGTDTLTTTTTQSSELGSGGLIATQDSSNPRQISHIAVRDSWWEGGNYTIDLAPSDGLPVHTIAASGNKFGLAHQFGPLRLPAGSTSSNNRWGESGSTIISGSSTTVTDGQLLPGSTA